MRVGHVEIHRIVVLLRVVGNMDAVRIFVDGDRRQHMMLVGRNGVNNDWSGPGLAGITGLHEQDIRAPAGIPEEPAGEPGRIPREFGAYMHGGAVPLCTPPWT